MSKVDAALAAVNGLDEASLRAVVQNLIGSVANHAEDSGEALAAILDDLDGYGLDPTNQEEGADEAETPIREPGLVQVAELLVLCEERSFESADLDKAVHDLAQEVGLGELNGLEDGDEQEEHLATQEEAASNINNGGLAGQVAFLLEHHGFEATWELLLGLEREKAL